MCVVLALEFAKYGVYVARGESSKEQMITVSVDRRNASKTHRVESVCVHGLACQLERRSHIGGMS